MSEQIVIVGFGPVAARLVDELLPALRAGQVGLTVIGQETEAAYNRVLVADLGVGRTTPEALALADAAALVADGVDVRLGVKVRRVDRARQSVILSDGTSAHYDRLVFATGSRPVIPNLTGLNPDPAAPVLPPGVTALRDLRDAEVLRRAVAGRKRVVVLGGGVLGLETALAAAEEGATVTVVHNGPHPLGRNIDRGGGAVLAASLRSCGVRVAGNARSTGVEHNGPDGGFSALLLDDGSAIDGDLLVLSCGVRPRIELAEGCGLSTGAGILVDHRLRAHHEPHIFAIGDCAEVRCPDPACTECRTARGPSGLVGPGWRQAEWLAEYLVLLSEGSVEDADSLPPLPQEKPGVIVLKARGMNMAVAGDNSAEPWDEEVLTAGAVNGRPRLQIAQWADPEHGRYVKMTTRGGVLEGLVSVGMPRTAGELVQLFERGAELPADRSLLLRLDGPDQLASAGASNDPESTVCRCAGVSGGKIADAAAGGCSTVAEVSAATRAGTGCGGCHEDIRGLIEKHFQGAAA
ncbi:putative nitrite reductase large subunit [Arthrobacter globiformis NBRC 12137]|jgi:assimilatory nitrate reductase electron transfer subunit|uniref:Putative nitrite reductase large subunit n=1 Tax=Arthrobacter globiformis (strain ATCC 8010 / DSM 20124 / JCM 1332 / NBRC 12137 / NCIMB 8907 / NRRL B-2979 / 168) TaxID=1077972 RepID=H0QMH1_ARTG1|nr:FAD-dependent oxidoreductase [Arthrobacter globiformis]GAB14022.1 putative nitrite reductase large subunit [Arthrobacter globiformis NBRC 12137]